MRRGALLQMLVFALLAAGVGVVVALFIPWLPKPASKEADRIDLVFWVVIGICIFIFAIVASMLTYAVIHFRAAPGDESDGKPIHGHTGVEIAWTVVPTILVTAIGVLSAVILGRNDNAGAHPLRIHVTAQQFAWSFSYPEAGNLKTAVLRLPVHRSVLLDLSAKDVIHSFWVPEFGQKQDAVPGLHPTLHVTPTRTGTFPVICTELCGAGHALMRSQVIVMPRAAFDRWLAAQKQGGGSQGGGASAGGGGSAGGTASLGAQAFANNGCGACHVFTPAKAAGKVGPDLDKLAEYAQRAHQPLADFVRTSIVKPNAYVEKGYPAGAMPPNFGSILSKQQLDALVQYLITRKG